MAPLDVSSGPSYGTVEQTEQSNDDEREQLLSETDPIASEVDSIDGLQEGVQKIEAINLTWTTRSLIIAYVRYVGHLSG